jgi:DNA-binding FrmR family transcriptional regulator
MQSANPQTKYDARYIANRMARAIGHVKLVRNMVEAGADCTEVLIQLAAVRGQLDSICSSLMVQYAEQFAEDYRRTGDPELLEDFKTELAKAVKK